MPKKKYKTLRQAFEEFLSQSANTNNVRTWKFRYKNGQISTDKMRKLLTDNGYELFEEEIYLSPHVN